MAEKRKKELLFTISLLLILVIGTWLRYRCLGCLGFRGDEDLTALAVKALSVSGVPELPSGMIYLRFYPYQWLLSLSINWFGFSEYAMRLPGVIFGTLLIPAAYYVTSKLTNRNIAFIVAVGIAISFSQVEMSRTARMYAPFFLVYLLAAYAIYQAHFADRDRLWSPVAIILCFAALSLQQLAYSLAIFYLLAIPLRPTLRRTVALITQSGLVAIGFVVFKKIQDRYFYRARDIAESLEFDTIPDPDGGGVVTALLSQISVPDSSLFQQTVGSSALTGAAFVILLLALLTWCWRGANDLEIWPKLVGISAILFAAGQQFNLTLAMLGLVLVISKQGLGGLRSRNWLRFAIASAVFFVTWVSIAVAISKFGVGTVELADAGVRKTLRLLIDYPNYRLLWSFVIERPLLALPLLLGTLWGIEKISQPEPDPTALFLTGGFWGVLFANGVLETKFEFFRYNLHVDVLYLMLVTIGVVRLPDILRSIGVSSLAVRWRNSNSTVWLAVAGVLVALGVRPDLALLTTDRDYYEAGSWYARSGLTRYPDFRNPGRFVQTNLEPDDQIFVFDPREYWNYIGRVDYWIWSDNYQSQSYKTLGQDRDLYLGVPIIHSLPELQTLLAEEDTGDIWILYAASRLAHTQWVTPEIKSFMLSLDDRIVFRGQDRDTVVIRLKPEDLARQVNGSLR